MTSKDQQLIHEAYKICTEGVDGIGNWSVKKIDKWTEPSNEPHSPDVTYTTYNILKNGKVVGNLKQDDYFGYVNGELFNRNLPELSSYSLRNQTSGPLGNLHRFLKSKTGQKWLTVSQKRGHLDVTA